jgi:hypothetical protein
MFPLTSFQYSNLLEVFGTYMFKETATDNVIIAHKIQLQKDNLCTWHTTTKSNGVKKKCKRTGNFKISGDKITLTWSRNECTNCGTYANWYDKECPSETLEYKENTLWFGDKTTKRLIRIR